MLPVIAVENLSKKYIIGHQKQERYTALRDVLANGAKRLAHKLTHPFAAPDNDPTHEEFWALKNVSFDIQQGDRVGIIGRNGAGKSTLLKILSRITEPTSGKVSIKGRVASLLEVGTGFHPELTGRENIFLNGAILGMSRAEIRKKFDEIVAFSEVEKFLDTPVKRYSSGMYVRLAFAVAAHLESEILVVDEVLAVGDEEFQRKCMGKIENIGKDGRTVIFVSHNMGSILSLCDRGLLLKDGAVSVDSPAAEAVGAYLRSGTASDHGVFQRRSSSGAQEMLLNAELLDGQNMRRGTFEYGERMRILLRTSPNVMERFGVEIRIKNSRQQLIAYISSWINRSNGGGIFTGGDTIAVDIPALKLVQDTYYLDFICRIPQVHHVDNWWDSVNFTVSNCRPQGSPISIQEADQLGQIVLDDVTVGKAIELC